MWTGTYKAELQQDAVYKSIAQRPSSPRWAGGDGFPGFLGEGRLVFKGRVLISLGGIGVGWPLSDPLSSPWPLFQSLPLPLSERVKVWAKRGWRLCRRQPLYHGWLLRLSLTSWKTWPPLENLEQSKTPHAPTPGPARHCCLYCLLHWDLVQIRAAPHLHAFPEPPPLSPHTQR